MRVKTAIEPQLAEAVEGLQRAINDIGSNKDRIVLLDTTVHPPADAAPRLSPAPAKLTARQQCSADSPSPPHL